MSSSPHPSLQYIEVNKNMTGQAAISAIVYDKSVDNAFNMPLVYHPLWSIVPSCVLTLSISYIMTELLEQSLKGKCLCVLLATVAKGMFPS